MRDRGREGEVWGGGNTSESFSKGEKKKKK